MINSGVILVSELPSELSKRLWNPTLTPPQGCGCVVNKLAFFALLKMSPQLKELYPDMAQIDIFWYLIYMTISHITFEEASTHFVPIPALQSQWKVSIVCGH